MLNIRTYIYFSNLFTGTVEGDCKFQTANSYGFCDCVELVPDYYDEDFIGNYQKKSLQLFFPNIRIFLLLSGHY